MSTIFFLFQRNRTHTHTHVRFLCDAVGILPAGKSNANQSRVVFPWLGLASNAMLILLIFPLFYARAHATACKFVCLRVSDIFVTCLGGFEYAQMCIYASRARVCESEWAYPNEHRIFERRLFFLGVTILRYRSTMVSRVCAIAGACSGVPFSPGLCLRGPHCVSMFIWF